MTSTVPVPGGVTAVIVVLFTTVYELAAAVPNFTEVAPENPLPAMVTVVPPEAGPELGLSLVSDVAMAAIVADGGYTTNVVESLAPPVEVTLAVSCCGAGLFDEQPLGGGEIAVIVALSVDVEAEG